MRIDKTHLVLEPDGDSLDHVLNVGCNGTDASHVLAVSVPDFDAKLPE